MNAETILRTADGQRIDHIQISLSTKVYLNVIFLLGSRE